MDNAPPTRPVSSSSGNRSTSPLAVRSRSRSRSRSSTRKQPEPSYDAAALMLDPSPLLTSSLHSRNSATTAQESEYLKRARWLGWTRLGLALLTIASATAAVGCAGHVLHRYNATHLESKYHLSLWPPTVDLRPTVAILASAGIITAINIGYLVFWSIPTPHSRTLLFNVVFMVLSVVGLILCIFAIPFDILLTDPSHHHQRESLQSWTCKFSDGARKFKSDMRSLQFPVSAVTNIPIPAGFGRLCKESQVSTGLVVAVLSLQALSWAVAALGIFLERKMAKARTERYANVEKAQHDT